MIGLDVNTKLRKMRELNELRWRVLELAEEDGETIPCVCSTDDPVQMRDAVEILKHEDGAVDLSRAPLPLVASHDLGTIPFGVVDQLRVVGGKLRGLVKFGNSARAREMLADVKAGVLRSLSVGYHALEWHWEGAARVVTEWAPYEVSCVAAPADIGAGFFRSLETHMDLNTESERERCAGIVRAGRMLGQEPEMLEAIAAGESVGDFRLKAITRAAASPGGAVGLTKREATRYSIFGALAALRRGVADQLEHECSRAIFQKNESFFLDRGINSGMLLVPAEVLRQPLDRALATTPGASGGYLVGNQQLGFVDVLRERAVLGRLGAQFITGLAGNATLARGTGTVTVTWQAGDGTSITATDQALGQLSCTPRTAIALTDVSEQVLTQGGELAQQFFMTDLARATAVAVDKAGLIGAGGAEPLGVLNTPGITSGQDAASATYAKILAFPKTAATANAAGTFAFVANAASAELLANRVTFSGGSRPVWDGALTDGQLVGYPALASEQMPAATLLFGPWDDVAVVDWGVLAISLDRGGPRFNAAQVGIRAIWIVDVLVRQPAQFVAATNLS